MHPSQPVAPFNQRIRITILRLVFLSALPVIVFGRSAWPDGAFELLEVLGLALLITAILGRFWSILYIGGRKNATILMDGPYSVCRHPLYLFTSIGVAGFGLMLGSAIIGVVMAALVLGVLTITAKREEVYLRATFGPAYDAYAARVPMILPRPGLFHSEGTIAVSVKTLRSNLMDTLGFLLTIPVAELIEYLHETDMLPSFPIW